MIDVSRDLMIDGKRYLRIMSTPNVGRVPVGCQLLARAVSPDGIDGQGEGAWQVG